MIDYEPLLIVIGDGNLSYRPDDSDGVSNYTHNALIHYVEDGTMVDLNIFKKGTFHGYKVIIAVR